MRIVSLLSCVLLSTIHVFAQYRNPFLNKSYTLYADSMATYMLKILTTKEKCAELAGPKNYIGIAMRSIVTGKGIPATPMGAYSNKVIPSLYFSDGPRGITAGKHHTVFPVPICCAATWDVNLQYRIGEAMGIEADTSGIGIVAAPCMNILRHPANGRAQEAFGEDPFLTAQMAVQLMMGIQSKGVMATAKHFALNSIENTRYTLDVRIDERSLHEVYLPHFKTCVDSGIASIMSSYNKVNGSYCAENRYLLNDVLRKQWGFKGFVHSDWQFGVYHTEQALHAGLNMEMMRPVQYTYPKINNAFINNSSSENRIDSLLYDILFTKYLFKKYKEEISYSIGDHRKLAYLAARDGAVLLKNENAILPLNRDSVKHIVLIGSLIHAANDGDKGSSAVSNTSYVSAGIAYKDYAKINNIHLTCIKGKSKNQIDAACAKADVIIVLAGYRYDEEGEYVSLRGKARKNPYKKPMGAFGKIGRGGDRSSLSLKERDQFIFDCLQDKKQPIIVHAIGGSAFTCNTWLPSIDALFMHWYYGQEGARCLPRFIFGEINPSGKLPVSFVKNESDLPFFPLKSDTITYHYYHGYTWLDIYKIDPQFAFGYGLSYSSFTISAPTISKNIYSSKDTIQVQVIVSNNSNRDGFETVQLYASSNLATEANSVKKLVAFKKVFLEKGTSCNVSFSITTEQFTYYDVLSHQMRVSNGSYMLFAGNSSRNIDLKATSFEIR